MKRLALLAVGLIVAFVVVPGLGAPDDLGSERRLAGTFRGEFMAYWSSGERAFDPGMQRVVDYWFRYHIAKAALAAALLAVLVVLGVMVWREFVRTRGLRAAGLATGGVLATALAVVSLAAVLANIHGMAAPFGSLLPMLFGAPAGPLDATLGQVRQQLAAGQRSGPLDMIMSDYVLFHEVMAVEGAIVAAGLVVLAVLLWRWFGRAEGRARRVLAGYGVFVPVLASALAVVVVANTTTAAHPLPGLEGFFAGGW
ncbi:hypothetical protein GCM10009630_67420 [Kribbella jejuensis]|uniref:Tat (Twin-arginine translocation) pathway signal sequence n=1 Tax=Kribbella jejuensis TaxID=236068 RepID=A0A542D9R0_9ACTN|nr:hypothetical protein [Kribbella jejuensis]TQI99815.1 hypothetical protein FB475_6803 [Kribbella jejuensis]